MRAGLKLDPEHPALKALRAQLATAGLQSLLPGDFVLARLESLVVPRSRAEYTGANTETTLPLALVSADGSLRVPVLRSMKPRFSAGASMASGSAQ